MQSSNDRPATPLNKYNGARRSAYRVSAGFTLVELVVVTAIAAILMSLAAPAIGAFRAKLEVRTGTDSLLTSLLFSRREAIMRNARVVMCKSSDGKNCAAAQSTEGWEQGWVIFQDLDNDAEVGSSDSILLRQPAIAAVNISGNKPIANYVSFNGVGVSVQTSGAFQSGTFKVSSASSFPAVLRNVVLSPGGRPRVEIPSGSA